MKVSDFPLGLTLAMLGEQLGEMEECWKYGEVLGWAAR